MASDTLLNPPLPHSPAKKVSRYRSVRLANADRQQATAASTAKDTSQLDHASIAKSMSRYRRKAQPRDNISAVSPPPKDPPPALDTHTSARLDASAHISPPDCEAPGPPATKSHGSRGSEAESQLTKELERQLSGSTFLESSSYDHHKLTEEELQRRTLGVREKPRHHTSECIKRHRMGRERREMVQAWTNDEREQEEQELSCGRQLPPPTFPAHSRPKSMRRNSKPIPHMPPAESIKAPDSVKVPESPTSQQKLASPREVKSSTTNYDAPLSAVNAGVRKVIVKCGISSIVLPVTPTTTPRDLIDAASSQMSEHINPPRSMLMESFAELGIQRPLREYEHIREVMNSWDKDSANALIIVSTLDDENLFEVDLDAKSVPKEQTSNTAVQMQHSCEPGKWDKRWIRLRSDGQIMIAKRQSSDPAYMRNICHLSDFDIYIPTMHHKSKNFKPPKKICFAIKSQQKSRIFVNGANFVHFFATNDKGMAADWYNAVHRWRSWYLFNVMGDGPGKTLLPHVEPALPGTSGSSSVDPDSSHRGMVAATPNVNPEASELRESQKSQSGFLDRTKSLYSRKLFSPTRESPPTSFPGNAADEGTINSLSAAAPVKRRRSLIKYLKREDDDVGTFAPSGLLGRSYSQRQKPQRVTDAGSGVSSNLVPLVGEILTNRTTQNVIGQSLVEKPAPTDHSTVTLRKSIRLNHKPTPLIDLTPTYQEPPQHSGKGPGVVLSLGKPLIDAATSLEQQPGAIITPSATTWRRPPSTASNDSQLRPSRSVRKEGSSQDRGPPQPKMTPGMTTVNGAEPFTGGSTLLARGASKHSQGGMGTGTGHGLLMRNPGRGPPPLVDLREGLHFQDGSLLLERRAERYG